MPAGGAAATLSFVGGAGVAAGRCVQHRVFVALRPPAGPPLLVCLSDRPRVVCSAYYLRLYMHQSRERTAERVGLVLGADGAAKTIPEVSYYADCLYWLATLRAACPPLPARDRYATTV
jgi:hypothetical protein